MKTVDAQAAQGDLLLRRLPALPAVQMKEVPREDGKCILAHSETGHHHAVAEPQVRWMQPLTVSGDFADTTRYLEVIADHADVVHHRDHDTHETLRLPKGIYEVRRQREHVPDYRTGTRSWDFAAD